MDGVAHPTLLESLSAWVLVYTGLLFVAAPFLTLEVSGLTLG